MIRDEHDEREYYRPGITGEGPGPREPIRTPPLDYPEHSTRHRVRILYEPGPTTTNRASRFIDMVIEHQIAIAMLTWLVLLTAALGWWMA